MIFLQQPLRRLQETDILEQSMYSGIYQQNCASAPSQCELCLPCEHFNPYSLTPESNAIRTCLLVDDDEDDREIFRLALHQVDPSVSCITACDGLEALSILKAKTLLPDYIFLDLNMPRMDGKECLREIRKQEHLAHIPVIIFSTSSADREKDETQRLGANSFIVKPSLLSTLADNLRGIFNNGQT